MSDRVFLALGSNVGDRLGHLRYAVQGLRRHVEVEVEVVSPVYESEAHIPPDGDGQAAYLNAVVAIRTILGPRALLSLVLDIERERGRDRTKDSRWAPRTLDMDVVLFGQRRVTDPDLTIPHPRLAERLFVLRPLADVAPGVQAPAPLGAGVAQLLGRCQDSGWLRRTPFRLDDGSEEVNDPGPCEGEESGRETERACNESSTHERMASCF